MYGVLQIQLLDVLEKMHERGFLHRWATHPDAHTSLHTHLHSLSLSLCVYVCVCAFSICSDIKPHTL